MRFVIGSFTLDVPFDFYTPATVPWNFGSKNENGETVKPQRLPGTWRATIADLIRAHSTAQRPAVPARSGLTTTGSCCLVAGQLRRRLSGRGPLRAKAPLACRASILLPKALPCASHPPPRGVATASPAAPALRCRLSLHPHAAHCLRDPPDLGRSMRAHHQAHNPNPNP